MKKFVIIFVILVLLGGVAFFFGWINIWVPAGSYTVMVSKTTGYDDTVVGPESGFTWRWQHLIPTNLTLNSFSLTEYTTRLTGQGSFPSAEAYSQAVPFSPDFSYHLDFTVAYRLRPQALLGLVKNQKLTPETLTAFYEKKKEVITGGLLEELAGFTDAADLALLKNPFALEKSLLTRLADKDAEVELTRLTPQGETKLPDPAVYALARKNYLALAEEQQKIAVDKLRHAQALYEKDDMAFDRSVTQLERYGELFNKYPVLLKYIFINRNPSAASQTVPELKDLFETKGPANQ